MNTAITLDALRVLDGIDRRGSFAAAADELHRVPSALSYVVHKLEDDLGAQLFDRSRRRAELTGVGRLVLEQGRQILKAADELEALARQAVEGWETELRIGIDTVLHQSAINDLIEAFQRLRPRTEIRLSEEVLGGSWDAIAHNRCDLIVGAEGAPPHQGFGIHPLGSVEFVFAVAADHPLTHLDEPIPTRAILDYPTVVVSDSSRQLPVRSSGLLDGRTRIRVATIAQKIQLQCRGLGIGYLPRHRIERELAARQLKALRLDVDRSPAQISVAWRREGVGRGLQWFIDELRKHHFDTHSGELLIQ